MVIKQPQSITGELKPLNQHVGNLEEGQHEMKTDIVELKSDVTELKNGQAKLESNVDKLETRLEKEVIDKVRALFDTRGSN